jgi:hypothetical protein
MTKTGCRMPCHQVGGFGKLRPEAKVQSAALGVGDLRPVTNR